MKSSPLIEAAVAQLVKDGNPKLRAEFPDGTTLTEPGTKLSSKPTAALPTVSIARSLVKPHEEDKYILMCLDFDAPFPSFNFLGPIAHGLLLDLAAASSSGAPSEDGWTTLAVADAEAQLIRYAGPGPPPPSAPHRYILLVWEQPAGLTNELARKVLGLPVEAGIPARMRWDQPAFEKKLGLGPPLAVNFWVSDSK